MREEQKDLAELKERTEYLWYKYNFTPQKKLGQNFLIDPQIVDRIIESLKLDKQDTVLEIGAGTGILTEKLAQKAKKVTGIEIDRKLCEILEGELKKYANLRIFCEDITQIFSDIPQKKRFNQLQSDKVVGNLPYQIASPLLLDLVKKKWIKFMVVMVQREVAERLLSRPGHKKRGVLTVLANYYARVNKIIDVPPQAFIPIPRVGSSLLKIERRKRYQAKNESNFFSIVKAAFSSRRKMLGNALSMKLGIDKELLKKKLARAGVEWKKRAEDLKVKEFVSISNELGGYFD